MRQSARDSSLTYRIRRATKDDLVSLLNLESICFKEETFGKDQLKSLLLKAKSIVLVVENNRSIIGSMIILLRKHIGNARIYSLNVHPGYRRRGIASSLLDTAFGLLKEKGYENITLEVGVNNRTAQYIYRSNGFIFRKELPFYYKNGDDALSFIKKL